jgi:polysaccharide biosynthesis protein PslG
MAKRLLRAALGLGLALCAAAWPAGSGRADQAVSAPPAAVSLLGGVDIGSVASNSLPGEADRTIAIVGQLHAKLVRVEVPWSVMEPVGSAAIDPRALAYTDEVVHAAAAAGIRVVMLVQSTPCWASSAPGALLRRCVPGRSGMAASWAPARPSDFGAFVAFLAGRYGTSLAAIEVWNEPDQANEAYLAGPSKAQHDAELLRAAYPAIKQANPNVLVLAGALVGSNGAFLRAMYAAGIKGYYDGLAVHYYNLTLASLRSIREVQLANGDTTSLWLDEFGWSSCWPQRRIEQEQGCVTRQVQAQNIANTFRSLARIPYVAAAILYKLRDSGGEEFGVLSTSGRRKPAFAPLAHVLASATGEVVKATLGLRRRGRQVIASGSGPVGDFMELEAFQGSVLRYRAVFTLDRFNRYSIALPAVLRTHGLSLRVYPYGTGPRRAAQAAI